MQQVQRTLDPGHGDMPMGHGPMGERPPDEGAHDLPPLEDYDEPQRGGWLRALMLSLLGVALLFLVVRYSLVAYLAETSPDRALIIAPGDPVALATKAERSLQRPKQAEPVDVGPAGVNVNRPIGAGDRPSLAAPVKPRPPVLGVEAEFDDAELAVLKARVEEALAASPTSARAMRLLAQINDLEGDAASSSKLLEAAVARSKHDSLAVLMMARRSFDAKNWEAAIFYADILMRSRNDLVQAATPLLVRLAEMPEANKLVKQALIAKPIWRGAFTQLMLNNVTDARTPLDLYLAMKEAGVPPTQAEIAAYLNFLNSLQYHDIAYYTWLQFLPPELMSTVGFVFNSGFELPLSGMPFDWTLPRPIDATVWVARVPEESNRALRIEFGSGRVQLGEIRQRLVLGAGNYKLQWRMKGQVLGRRGMRLVVSCATKSNDKISEGPMFIGQQAEWRTFEHAFTVPATCASQMLRIIHDARYSAEQANMSGIVWYDDIAISRAD